MKVSTNLLAEVEININSSTAAVWHALTDPEKISKYMFGSRVESEWKEGSQIIWKGNFKGIAFRDKGVIVEMTPEKILRFTHYSPLSKLPDTPENYHIVTIELSGHQKCTNVKLTQDNNTTEESKSHAEENWSMMLEGLKKLLEEEKA
ncbi:SRPBCC domain-containing protein [Pollutibacter soli]|uniref:SRPBCC domain-containing protein n=1 Tax=Pollutibacter soli TaxID=3034157 RepID=UPI0030137932